MNDKTVQLYIDMPTFDRRGVTVDDFLVSIGKKQSNSVYHVAEVVSSKEMKNRMRRYRIKCYRSELITALKRDKNQRLISIYWYPRKSKT